VRLRPRGGSEPVTGAVLGAWHGAWAARPVQIPVDWQPVAQRAREGVQALPRWPSTACILTIDPFLGALAQTSKAADLAGWKRPPARLLASPAG